MLLGAKDFAKRGLRRARVPASTPTYFPSSEGGVFPDSKRYILARACPPKGIVGFCRRAQGPMLWGFSDGSSVVFCASTQHTKVIKVAGDNRLRKDAPCLLEDFCFPVAP
jgi:hypothetical protein